MLTSWSVFPLSLVALAASAPLFADMPKLELVAEFHGHEGQVRDVRFSGDGNTLVTAADDGTVRFWTIPHFKPPFPLIVRSPQEDNSTIRCGLKNDAPVIGLSHDGKTLIIGDQLSSSDKRSLIRGQTCLRRWDITSREEIAPANNKSPLIVDSLIDLISPDGKFLLQAPHGDPKRLGTKLNVKLFDGQTGKLLGELPDSQWTIAAAFSPDSKRIAAYPTSAYGARIWETKSRELLFAVATGKRSFRTAI